MFQHSLIKQHHFNQHHHQRNSLLNHTNSRCHDHHIQTNRKQPTQQRYGLLNAANSQSIKDSQQIKGGSSCESTDTEKRLIHYIPSLIHDLRNPLQQLYACVELYKMQLIQMQNPLFEILSQSVNHMNDLITKALTTFQRIIERTDQDTLNQLNYSNVDISKYLEEFWTNNLPIAEQKSNVDYQILVQSSLPHYIHIPKLEVTQVIQNLFSNATKFTEKGSIKLIVSFHELSENESDDSTPNTQEHDLQNTSTISNTQCLSNQFNLSNPLNLQNSQNLQNNQIQQSTQNRGMKEQNQQNQSGCQQINRYQNIQLNKSNAFKQKDKNIDEWQDLNKIQEQIQKVKNVGNKNVCEGVKESSEQDSSSLIDVSKLAQKKNQQYNYGVIKNEYSILPSQRQIALSVGGGNVNGNMMAAAAESQKCNSVTNLSHFNDKEITSLKLQKKLQSITYQFDKLKYSQQQDNDYYTNTEEDVDEDYNESELNQASCTPIQLPYSTQPKQIDGFSEYYQYNNINPNNNNTNKQNISGQEKHQNQRSQYSLSSQTFLNNHQTLQQHNGTTPQSTLNSHTIMNDQNNQILSYNQIENSCTFSTSRSYHNSTPPTFQVHTFSDIQNAKNLPHQAKSSRQTTGENSLPTYDYSTQYHTPQMNPKNEFQTIKYNGFNNSDQPHNSKYNPCKGQIIHSQSSNNINEQHGKDISGKKFLTEHPSPDSQSVNSQQKNGMQSKNNTNNNINSFSSCDQNGEKTKNSSNQDMHLKKLSTVIPMVHQQIKENKSSNPYLNMESQAIAAELEAQTKQLTLSTVIKQQQQSKQNKLILQSTISNSYYYNCQQKLNSQSTGDLRSLKIPSSTDPTNTKTQNKQQIGEVTQSVKPTTTNNNNNNNNNNNKQSDDQANNLSLTQCKSQITPQLAKLLNNNEYCQIFSKRKSQIHPSIRDLVFSRNNIRNYQIRRVAQIKGYLKFEILDTGKGMDIEEQKHIFDIYKQANSSIKEHYGGTGIGLYSAKNIANQVHGDIFCHSQKGVGSAFIFYMPCEATFKTQNSQESKQQQQLPSDCKISPYQNQFQFSSKNIIQSQQQSNKNSNQESSSINQILTNQYSLQPNASSQNKSSLDKQQQLQIIQIKQGLKSADQINQKFEQQNKLIVIKQLPPSSCFSPSSQKKEMELQRLILKLEERKKKINLIYIDDCDFLLLAMEIIFSKIKCINLTIERSALKGLATIKSNSNKFDIALIDHEMPELNGNKLAQEIKQVNPNIILICHSGYPTTEDFQKGCKSSGFSYFLEKPCTFEHVVNLLTQVYNLNLANNQS